MWGISLLAENGLASQEGLCSMEWVSKQITAGLKTREQKFCARSANCKLYNFQPDITRQLSSNELSNLSTQNSGAEALRLPAVATLMFLETKSKGNYMWEFGGGGRSTKKIGRLLDLTSHLQTSHTASFLCLWDGDEDGDGGADMTVHLSQHFIVIQFFQPPTHEFPWQFPLFINNKLSDMKRNKKDICIQNVFNLQSTACHTESCSIITSTSNSVL